MPAKNVHHAFLCMLLAVQRSLASLYIEARLRHASVLCASLVANIHHAVVSMLLAVYRRRVALDVEPRSLSA